MEAGDYLRKLFDFFLHRPMNFSFVDEHVCASARIMSKKDLEWLKAKRVRAILALTETRAPSTWFEGYDIEYKHVPVKNHAAPTTEQLKEGVRYIESNIEKGITTLVHCAAGKGRTGTFVAAYLCEHENISADSAIRLVRSKRPGSVEKNPKVGQESSVVRYCELIKNSEASDSKAH